MNYPGEDPYDTEAFHAFIDQSFAQFIEAGAITLLIDLRDNPGGDNSFSDHMIAWFADEPFRFASDFRIRVSPETTASNAARLRPDDADAITRRFANLYAQAQTGDIVRFEIPFTQPRDGERFTGRVFALVNRRSYSNAANVAAIIQDYGLGAIVGEPTADLVTTYGAMEHFTLPNTGLSVGYPKAFILRPNGDRRIGGVRPDIAITTPIAQAAEDPVLQEALRRVHQR
jgi:C-terminal processing protease CtpA/Prc